MSARGVAFLDAHVHYHACYDPARFLGGAWANFRRAAAEARCGERFAFFLLLTEARGANWFEHLKECALRGSEIAPAWRARTTDHLCQLSLHGPEGARLDVVSGYQIVTAERLEVLALGSCERIADGLTMTETVEAVGASGAIPVVPWGFGKWLGQRGGYVRALLEGARPGQLFFGDNGNRLSGLPEPGLLRRARDAGFLILPGTDALPFASEADKTGGVGFRIDLNETVQDIHSWQHASDHVRALAPVIPYGRLESAWSFAKNQVAMQVHKRSRSAA